MLRYVRTLDVWASLARFVDGILIRNWKRVSYAYYEHKGILERFILPTRMVYSSLRIFVRKGLWFWQVVPSKVKHVLG